MPDALHHVAEAYRAVRRTGALDAPAHRAAMAAYLALHPNADPVEASRRAIEIVARAAREMPRLMWDGVGSPRESDPAKEAGLIPYTPEFGRRR